MSDLQCVHRFGVADLEKTRVSLHVVCCPPDVGWYKVNTDRASCGNLGAVAAGGVIRGSDASVLACFSNFLGIFTSFEAKIIAVCLAVDKAVQLHLPRIWIEYDSILVVDCLRRLSLRFPWHVRGSWQLCLNKLASLHFQVSHVYREGNKV